MSLKVNRQHHSNRSHQHRRLVLGGTRLATKATTIAPVGCSAFKAFTGSSVDHVSEAIFGHGCLSPQSRATCALGTS